MVKNETGNLLPPLHSFSVRLRSGQVSSEWLTCTFRASCCSARLTRAQVPAFAGSFVRAGEKRGEGSKGGPPALACTRAYEQSDRNRKQAEGGLRCYGRHYWDNKTT